MPTTEKFDRGALLLIETEFLQRTAHVTSPAFFDPTSPGFAVYDPSSTVVTSTSPLSASNASSAGLYHAVIQTSTGWPVGKYTVVVTAYDGSNSDMTVEPRIFELE